MLRMRRAIGILRETKNKWERRVPLIPSDVKTLVSKNIKVFVQPSNKRIFTDHEYAAAGATLTDDLSGASTIFGVKEIPPSAIIPNKSYILFNHVIKAQAANMPFLDACFNSNVRLFDYETIRATKADGGQRLVAFGKFAGLAGMIDAFHGLGERLLTLGYSSPFMGISMSYMYPSVENAKRAISELGAEIKSRGVPDDLAPMVFVFTGTGKVTNGSLEIFKLLPHEFVTPEELPTLAQRIKDDPSRRHKVFGCIITAKDMVVPNNGGVFDKVDYYNNPHNYRPVFHERIAPYTSVLVNGMYWDPRFPRLLSNAQMRDLRNNQRRDTDGVRGKSRNLGLLLNADITCDVGGSVEFLKRSSTLESPFFLYNPLTDQINTTLEGEGVVLLGVDNLPAEFPREASTHFSTQLAPFVEALASSDHSLPFEKQSATFPPEIRDACIVADGKLTPGFEYIAKLRESSRVPKAKDAAVRTGKEVESNIMLQGHLFDTGFINQALDLVEFHGRDFKVVLWDISPNRAERKKNLSRAVLQVTCADNDKLNDLLNAMNMLTAAIPFAAAKVTRLPSGTFVDDIGEQKQLPSSAAATPKATPSAAVAASGKKVLVLGAGYVAGPLVEYLAKLGHQITVASLVATDAQAIIAGQPNCTAIALDSADRAGMESQVGAADLVISLLPAAQHVPIAQLCIAKKKDMVTASYVSPAMRQLHEDAKRAGIAIINEVGLDPGIDHMSAMKVIDEVKAAGGVMTSFESWCGGLPAPEAADNPLGYKFSWSPLGVLLASQNAATYRRRGDTIRIEGPDLLRAAKPIAINPAFALEHLPNRDSLSYASAYGVKDLPTMYRGTLRYQGFSAVLDAVARLGLLNDDQIRLPDPSSWAHVMAQLLGVRIPTGASDADIRSLLEGSILARLVASYKRSDSNSAEWASSLDKAIEAMHWLGLTSPSQFVTLPIGHKNAAGHHSLLQSLCELLKQKLVYQGAERDMVLLYHKFGIRWPDGRKEQRTSTLITYGGDGGEKPHARRGGGGGAGYSAMARTVGLPTAMAAQIILERRLTRTGVLTPLTPDLYIPLLELLKKEGIECHERVTSSL